MLARAYIRAARTYVDPFDRICHGLRSLLAPATTDPKEVSGQFSRFNALHERAAVLYAVLTQC